MDSEGPLITRRTFVAAGALPVAAFCLPVSRAHVHLDYRNAGTIEHALIGGKCFVDGREIRQVFYADTREGIVKTYNAFGDGAIHAARCFDADLRKAIGQKSFHRLEAHVDGVYELTLRGRIELYASDGRRIF